MGEERRTRDSYDAYAARYDTEVDLYDRLMLGDGRSWACGQAAGTVLEVAVGTGRNLAHYPVNVRVCGLDVSSAMLDLAQRKAEDLDRDIALVEGDAQQLPFHAATFDTVLCTLGLSSIPDHAAALAEMYRVLRPGGRMVLLGHVASPHRAVRGLQALVEWLGRTASRPRDHQRRHVTSHAARTGFVITHRSTTRGGVIERLVAQKPDP